MILREGSFRKKGKVVVAGLTGQSAFLRTESFPRPGETISCNGLFFEPGGKGHNQAIACARTGAKTSFIGAVGLDDNGEACEIALKQEGIRTLLIKKDTPTAFAVITTDADGENTVEVFGGAAKMLRAQDLARQEVRDILQDCDFLLMQNELPRDFLEHAIDIAEEAMVPIIFNPAPAAGLEPGLLAKCWMITPNYGEAKMLAGFAPEVQAEDKDILHAFTAKGIKRAAVTLGAEGVLVINDGRFWRAPAFAVAHTVDTTGAGDVFNGILAGTLALGMRLEAAVQTAITAAGTSVTRRGAAGSIPSAEEISHWMSSYKTG